MVHYRHIWLSLWFALIPLLSQAHNENELVYAFSEDGLTVQLTPLTLIDLLRKNGEIPGDQKVVQFESHRDFIEGYFNAQLKWKVSGEDIRLKLEEMDLGGHDGVLRFAAENAPSPEGEVSIIVNAFTEVYRRCSNLVQWTGGGQAHSCQLDASHRECLFTPATRVPNKNPILLYVIVGVAVALLTFLVRIVIRRRLAEAS